MTIDVTGGLLNAFLYMGPMAVIGGLVAMYFWERTARLKVKVILVKTAGGTDIHYAAKEGDNVTLSNPKTGWSGVWPISDLATIPLPYPDLAGILPRFLQREIQTAIFVEGDLEPLLNRSAHRYNVASPNVVNALQEVLEALPQDSEDKIKLSAQIKQILANTATGPTRELVASPDWVGALRKSTALKALASVSDDLMEALKQIRNQLARFSGLNSTYVYIGLILIVVLLGFNLYYTIQGANTDTAATIPPDVLQKIDAIYYNIMGPLKK